MLKDRIQKVLNKKISGDNKKSIENLIMFLILLIITIISINLIWGDNKNIKVKSDENNNSFKQLASSDEIKDINSTINNTNEYNLEEDLENILSKISGVGKVKALITYYETSEIVPMYNEKYSTTITEETDTRWSEQEK